MIRNPLPHSASARSSARALGAPLLSLLACLAMTLPAHAADARKATARPATKPAAKPSLMSRDELRACIKRDNAIAQHKADLAEQRDEHEKLSAQLDADAQTLKDARASVDMKNPEAIAAFNARLNAHNEQAERANAQVDALQAAQDKLVAENDSYVADCGARGFSKADEDALRAEGLTFTKASTTQTPAPAASGKSKARPQPKKTSGS